MSRSRTNPEPEASGRSACGSTGSASPPGLRPRAFFWIFTAPLVAYLGLIVILSHQEAGAFPSGLPHDKLLHALEYGPVGALLLRWWAARRNASITWTSLALVVVGGAVFAVSDEIHQRFVPGRKCDGLDVAADTVGVIAGALLYALWHRVWASRREA